MLCHRTLIRPIVYSLSLSHLCSFVHEHFQPALYRGLAEADEKKERFQEEADEEKERFRKIIIADTDEVCVRAPRRRIGEPEALWALKV